MDDDAQPPPLPPRPQHRRRDRDRDRDLEPATTTDLAERMIAFQRRTAAATRPRERAERPQRSSPTLAATVAAPSNSTPPLLRKIHTPTPQVVVSPIEANADDFLRKLKISSSPRQSHAHPHARHTDPTKQSKLFNPDLDAIPMRRTAEPEAISDVTSSSYGPRGGSLSRAALQQRDGSQRHLFDPHKDDPVRFSVSAQPRPKVVIAAAGRPLPTPKSSGEYVSASSTSSYAHSVTSSSFTLSSGTSGTGATSSAPSSLFERQNQEESGNNAFAVQLKKMYRDISALESKIMNEDSEDAADEGRITVKGRKEVNDLDAEMEKWKKMLEQHKRLAEMMHNLLELTLAPSVPASLRNIPSKYNIIIRLWTNAFHRPLETLRRASFASHIALEYLQEYIYYAYTFYTGLLEEQVVDAFRAGWLEALGDLARYRMAVSPMVASGSGTQHPRPEDTASSLSALLDGPDPESRIDGSPSPSVGLAAARALDVQPEKERWRSMARLWYAMGLADTPGTGKLHHHLGLLSRDAEGEDLRAVYHYVKSMTTLHPFSTSRESVLPLWSPTLQVRRALPDARVPDLFVLLHGMLFTNIQLDDFQPTLARFLERLQLEGADEKEWIMMAIVNLGAVLEYGRPTGVLRRAGGLGGKESPLAGKVRIVKRAPTEEHEHDHGEKKMDVDEEAPSEAASSPALSEAQLQPVEHPAPFRCALQLAFSMFAHVLRNPLRRTATPFAALNPYITVVLTFLTTVLKQPPVLEVLERAVPWEALAAFLATTPRGMLSQADGGVRLTSGCAPLPEDWCLRGMEWGGRRVYERGFWKSGEDRHAEMEVLDATEASEEATDGIIEDEDEDEGVVTGTQSEMSDTNKRWVRIVRAAAGIEKVVDGFSWEHGTRVWKVEGALAEKVARWREDERQEREDEELRRRGSRWIDDSMEVDEDEDESEESEDDVDDSDEVKALKARRRYLRSLLQSAQRVRPAPTRQRAPRKLAAVRTPLRVVAGFTVLVIDTNILLSSLPLFSALVKSLRWTIIIPLPVITELDGLSSNLSQLGEAATAAITYITTHLRSHATSLKVQTSKGNYLTSLTVRSEEIDFDRDESSWDRNMDDLILRAAVWQDEHWVDRSALLSGREERDTTGAVKVVLLTFDRNLRLKARARQLDAADEKDMASILATGT